MKLIGRYDSAYVRRVGVSLHLLAIPLELQPLSPFSQGDELRTIAPVGRMPALVLDDGEVLIESAAILDWLDEMSRPDWALLPSRGDARRRHLRILASSTRRLRQGDRDQLRTPASLRKDFRSMAAALPGPARCRACGTGELQGARLAGS
jgi:glutathione S-transferase